MTISQKDSRLMLLLSSIIIIIPAVVFPARLGIDLGAGSFSYAIVEIAYYCLVLFIARPGAGLLKVFQGAAFTFLYRIVIGTIFGIVIGLLYDVTFSAALALGVSRYFPGILFHIALAPFITKSFYLAMVGETSAVRKIPVAGANRPHRKIESHTTQPGTDVKDNYRSSKTSVDGGSNPAMQSVEEKFVDQNQNGFERAVNYVGGHHAVKVAVVVDHEGLTVATYKRGEIDPEEWAPLAMVFKDLNSAILGRLYDTPDPEKIILTINQDRLSILSAANFNLMVLAGREDDDLLGIRLAQAADMIRKYVSERYDTELSQSPEEKYVPGT
jgi:predicted regulator of Ras-like GTPase activity (Roadblock/LC7/MglB family)